jgi:hypothetical protein
MSEKHIPESWVGQTVHLLDKQDKAMTEGELLEVNDRGVVLRVTNTTAEAHEDRPVHRYGLINFYPWTTVRFLYVYEGEDEIISEEDV